MAHAFSFVQTHLDWKRGREVRKFLSAQRCAIQLFKEFGADAAAHHCETICGTLLNRELSEHVFATYFGVSEEIPPPTYSGQHQLEMSVIDKHDRR